MLKPCLSFNSSPSLEDAMVVFHLASVMSGQGEKDFDICWKASWKQILELICVGTGNYHISYWY